MRNRNEKESLISKVRRLLYRYRHAWVLSYCLLYMPWFAYLEKTVTTKFHIITMPFDLSIPFCEYFVIPYLLWFAYVACAVLYFFFKDRNDYYRLCAFLFTGMTVFLIVSTIYPNGHYLRPSELTADNWCKKAVIWLYQADTATNLFPSIHVYNSLGVHIAVTHSKWFRNRKGAKAASFALCTSIILSTMFLKQHSVFDVMTAFGMALIMYYFIYSQAYQRIMAYIRLGLEQKRQRDVAHDFRM